MNEIYNRCTGLIGEENINKLFGSTVAVFGIGGVGSYTIEALARSGVGNFILIDSDTVDITNINRQIIATLNTVGIKKTDVAKQRILSINKDITVTLVDEYITDTTALDFIKNCDYVIDAIDFVRAKIHIAEFCKQNNIPVISAMGAGNKTDPTLFEVTDLSKTSVCPLCKAMRTGLKKLGIQHLKVVYSKETPKSSLKNSNGRPVPSSLAFVPSVMGLIIAREVVFDIIGDNNDKK